VAHAREPPDKEQINTSIAFSRPGSSMSQTIKFLFYLLLWLSIMAFGFIAAVATKGNMPPLL